MKKKSFYRIAISIIALCATSEIFAAPKAPPPKPVAAKPAPQRSFYKVLDSLLDEFEKDLVAKQVFGVKDIAIRNVNISSNLQPNFKSRLELLVSEKIFRTSQARVVHCVVCRTSHDASQIDTFAKMNQIKNFLDIDFVYSSGGMILTLNIFEVENAMMVWSKIYDSSALYAAEEKAEREKLALEMAIKRAAQKKTPTQEGEEAPAEVATSHSLKRRYQPTIFGVSTPKKDGGSVFVPVVALKVIQPYSFGKKEWALQAESYLSKKAFPNFNIGLILMHQWVGGMGAFTAGLGATYSKTYFGGVARVGYDFRFGKSWVLSTFAGYRPKVSNQGGIEFGGGLGFSF